MSILVHVILLEYVQNDKGCRYLWVGQRDEPDIKQRIFKPLGTDRKIYSLSGIEGRACGPFNKFNYIYQTLKSTDTSNVIEIYTFWCTYH